jgi:predicted nuclease of predicted toxin-antitoxin system
LSDAGYDVVCVSDWNQDPGDEEILRAAFEQQRVVVTRDKDFGELAVREGKPHCGIIRLVRVPAEQQGQVAVQALTRYGPELQQGAIITADPFRMRIRSASAGG